MAFGALGKVAADKVGRVALRQLPLKLHRHAAVLSAILLDVIHISEYKVGSLGGVSETTKNGIELLFPRSDSRIGNPFCTGAGSAQATLGILHVPALTPHNDRNVHECYAAWSGALICVQLSR